MARRTNLVGCPLRVARNHINRIRVHMIHVIHMVYVIVVLVVSSLVYVVIMKRHILIHHHVIDRNHGLSIKLLIHHIHISIHCKSEKEMVRQRISVRWAANLLAYLCGKEGEMCLSKNKIFYNNKKRGA